MAENVYEGMFILDMNRYERDSEGLSRQISKIIEEAGGEMLVSRFWEERRLAYPIKGQRRGSYWLTYFRMDGRQLARVEHQCKLHEHMLRVLFLKIEPRLADMLVAHAQATPTAEKKPAEASQKEAKESAEKNAEKNAEKSEETSEETSTGTSTEAVAVTEESKPETAADQQG